MCLPEPLFHSALPAFWLQNSLSRMQIAGTTAQAHIPDCARVRSARELCYACERRISQDCSHWAIYFLPLPRRLQFKMRLTCDQLSSVCAERKMRLALRLKVNLIAFQSNKRDALFPISQWGKSCTACRLYCKIRSLHLYNLERALYNSWYEIAVRR
jgi:hypothetical protein